MKRTFALLVVALVFLFATISPVSAVITPRDFPSDPGGGSGGGEDGDHPWGGDRVIGGGGSTRDVRASALTGYPAVDIFVTGLREYLSLREYKRDVLTGRNHDSVRTGFFSGLAKEVRR